MLIREEVASDREAIHKVHENAFDSPLEANLVDLLRSRGKSSISLVAEEDGKVIGHVMFSPVDIDPPSPGWNNLGLAPIAVIPERQQEGVGKTLINEGLEKCHSNGIGAVVLLGDPEYYQRFGFKRAMDFGLGNEYRAVDEFLVVELVPGILEGIEGAVRYAQEFNEVGV